MKKAKNKQTKKSEQMRILSIKNTNTNFAHKKSIFKLDTLFCAKLKFKLTCFNHLKLTSYTLLGHGNNFWSIANLPKNCSTFLAYM